MPYRLLTRTILIPFTELKEKHNFEAAYKFSAELKSVAKNARKDFGVFLSMENELINASEDRWMGKVSAILGTQWSARDQLNYGFYIYATAKVSSMLLPYWLFLYNFGMML